VGGQALINQFYKKAQFYFTLPFLLTGVGSQHYIIAERGIYMLITMLIAVNKTIHLILQQG
jgi:hypothetical protein